MAPKNLNLKPAASSEQYQAGSTPEFELFRPSLKAKTLKLGRKMYPMMQNNVLWLARRRDATLVSVYLNHGGTNRNLNNSSYAKLNLCQTNHLDNREQPHVGVVQAAVSLTIRILQGWEVISYFIKDYDT